MSKMTEEQKQRGQMIDYLAKQRGISRDELVAMLQRTVREAARKAVRNYLNVDVEIDDKNNITCFAKLTVVEKVVDPSLEIDIAMARTRFPDAKVGDEIAWKIETQDFGRIASQAARGADGIHLRLGTGHRNLGAVARLPRNSLDLNCPVCNLADFTLKKTAHKVRA